MTDSPPRVGGSRGAPGGREGAPLSLHLIDQELGVSCRMISIRINEKSLYRPTSNRIAGRVKYPE